MELIILLLLVVTTLYSSSSSAISLQSSFPQEALPTKSGYLTINSTSGSSIFYTYYEAQKPRTPLSETPFLIWLQGGPGCSSMVGNFYELGPFRVSSSLRQNVEHLVLEPNPGSWNRMFGVLFIDNPIGTGFSIASSPEEIPRNQHDVAKHLFIAMREFVGLDKLFENRPFYVTGESYAGKYVPAFAYYMLRKNKGLPKSRRLNLAGAAIGNGLTDPEAQVGTHALNAYYSGLINEKQKTQLEKLQEEAIRLTRNGNWSKATSARSRVLSRLRNMTGLATLFDFRRLKPYEDELVAKFLSNVEVKRALKARESIVFHKCSDLVKKVLHDDVMKSVRYMVEFLVKNTKVLLYQGQCDLRDGVVSTEAWMKKMKWEGIGKFLEAERNVWRVNGELAGYMQKWENLTHVVVMNAGHLMPTDQAVNSQAMIEDWVSEKGLFATSLIKQKPSNIAKLLTEDWEGAIADLKEAAEKSPQDRNIRELMRAERSLKLSQRKDWYTILGVSKTASVSEIKKAYKKLALQWHPDKNVDNREEAKNKFREIAATYEVLGDEEKRSRYDQWVVEDSTHSAEEGSSSHPTVKEGILVEVEDLADSIF